MEITEGRVPPPGELPFECAACGATVFADERSPPEKLHLCPNCAFEPGDLAVDRETGDLLVVARVTDRRADAVEIPGRDCTVAAYPKNERYDPSDPVVEVMYPIPAGLESDDLKPHHLRRYSFPHGRLERHRPARVDGGGGGADGNRDDQRRLNEFAAV